MQEEIKSLLARVKLPPLSFDLLHKLGDPNCDLESVADSISLDASLTASLLRICNSAVFGSQEPVSSVAEAIGRAGFQSVYMLAATLYGSSCFAGFRCCCRKSADEYRCRRRSIGTTCSCRSDPSRA